MQIPFRSWSVGCAALIAAIAFGGWFGPARAADKADAAWNEAETVIVAKLTKVQRGPTARSFPPIYNTTLVMKIEKVLRGSLRPEETVTMHHAVKQTAAPEYPLDKTYLISAKESREGLEVVRLEESSEKLVADVTIACSLPLGWLAKEGKPVSPWASFGKHAWTDNGEAEKTSCSVTARPTLMLGEVTLEVEGVPPAKDIKWTNPDGDGPYKITVTNPTDKPLKAPALLTDGKQIVWENSLVLICQGKSYACPGFKPDAGKLTSVTLEPKQSVSTTVNILQVRGPEWPQGGYRIEFQFCLGEKSRTKSFYYMSKHHDALREAAVKEIKAAEKK